MKKLLYSGVIALVCLGLYEVALRVIKVQPRGASLGFENQIRLEDYGQAKDVQGSLVLVGSSVTQNLTTTGHAPGLWDLGISGGGALTGCEAILRKGVNPRAVLIEKSITLAFPADEQLLKSPAKLREMEKSGSPIALLLGQFLSGSAYVPPDDADIHRLQELHMADFGRDPKYNVAPTDARFVLALRQLREFVEAMHAKGVPVYFFQVRPYASLTRQRAFPVIQSVVDGFVSRGLAAELPPVEDASARSVDGVHLVRPDAEANLRVILGQVGAARK